MVTGMRSTALFLVILVAASGAMAAPAGVDEPQRVYEDVGREPHLGRQIYDAVLLRPLGFVQLAVGTALLLPLYPVSLLAGRSDDLFRACVADPFERTFRRPLGQL
jgi:hypothetical protein